MLGGGAGSIDHMIKTLRNNRLLLKRKRRYFRGKFSYKEIREYYSIKIGTPLSKADIDQAALDRVRKELIQEQRKRYIKLSFFSFIVLIALCVPIYFLFQLSFTGAIEPASEIQYDDSRYPYSKRNRGN